MANGASSALRSADNLWASLTSMRKYDVVLMACEGDDGPSEGRTAAQYAAVRGYADIGGRIFGSHYHNNWIRSEDGQPNQGYPKVVNFSSGAHGLDNPVPFPLMIDVSFPKGVAFRDWLVAVDAEERSHARAGGKGPRGGIVEVRLGSTIEPEWLLDLFPDRIEEVDQRAFDEKTLRVERKTGLRYGTLMLDETVAPAPLDDETARMLADAVLARGIDKLPGGDALPSLLNRLAFARRQAPGAHGLLVARVDEHGGAGDVLLRHRERHRDRRHDGGDQHQHERLAARAQCHEELGHVHARLPRKAIL